MKNLIIIGIPRSGKSTLGAQIAKKIAQSGHAVSLVSGDMANHFLSDMSRLGWHYNLFWRPAKHLLPSLFEHRKQKLKLQTPAYDFLKILISCLQGTDNIVIFESAHITIEEAIKLFNPKKFKIVAMGMPDMQPDEKFRNIRKYDVKTWASRQDDTTLMESCKYLIKESKKLQRKAKIYNIPFINTSRNYNETIQEFADNIFEFLK